MMCLRRLIDANHVRLSGVKSWNGLTCVQKQEKSRQVKNSGLTHVTHQGNARREALCT